nr:FimV/HubP family polar landmark protein [Limnobacter parvus]
MASSFAQAAQLGKLEVLSGAGEPFSAQIQVDSVAPEERATLQAKLASTDAFRAARLTMDPNLQNLRFSVEDGAEPGTARVKITADKPLPAGFIDTLVELTWAGGRVAREYTLTVPVGPTAAQEAPATRLPEIRPPMTQPTQATPPLQSQPASLAPPAQPTSNVAEGGSIQVQRGDTLSELALELAGDGVTLNQAMAALYEANKESFINGSVHMIREGAQIQVPNRAALRARSGNEALLVLAQNDDRNVYSAYARQIGLLTVENQSTAASATSTQGTIAPVQDTSAAATPKVDRLQIAPGAAQGTNNPDASAEELTAKNKALAEANERIALLEKNVSDLQRLLDMQEDVSEPVGAAVEGEVGIGSGSDSQSTDTDTAAALELPSDTLSDLAAEQTDEATANTTEGATEGTEAPVAEALAEDMPFDWMPWILAGAGGLAVFVILLLIARSRRNKTEEEEKGFDADDNASFSEVNQFDEAAAAASTSAVVQSSSSLNKSEDSDFDLDEVLNDRLKQAEPEQATQLSTPVPADPVQEEPTPSIDDIPELNEASDEALKQKDSLNSELTLEFPEEDAAAADTSNSILDDLDEIEKGTLAAQEELEEIRKQPISAVDENDFDASSAFDDLIESNPDKKESALDKELEESGAKSVDSNAEDAFDQAMVDLDVDVPNPKVDDATWQEVATKLDLAGAYVEIGDADGAKELLNEIVKKGDVDQVRKAKALLATLN